MGLLTREQLLTKEELKVKRVDINKEKGTYVYVRMMTAYELNQFMNSIRPNENSNKIDFTDFHAKMAVRTMCDENGELLLGLDDIRELSLRMSSATIGKITDEATILNKIDLSDEEATKGVEKKAKNSETDQPKD